MQELTKLWKEFEASHESKNDEKPKNGPTLDVRIPAEYITATNRQVLPFSFHSASHLLLGLSNANV